MKKNSILLSLIAIPLLVACGGGSSVTDTAKTTVATAKISGTVPGTLIEAFCEDGTYVQVTSTQNGTSQHPFELVVPQNTNCKLVMTTNENDPLNRVITPIGFINGSATGSTITINADINLTHIPLELVYADANDTNGDHIVDMALVVDLNNSQNIGVNDTTVYDSNNNGDIDAYEDDDNNSIVNAYEDDDEDGIENIHDDDDNNSKPDYIEDDDNDGVINHQDDDDNNTVADYVEDDDNDGVANHIDDDNNNTKPDYVEDDDNDGIDNHMDDDDDNDGIDDEDEDEEDDHNTTSAP